MRVRAATPADLPQLIELTLRLKPKTPWAGIELDRPALVRTYSMCMSSLFGCAFVLEDKGGRVTGMIIGVAQQLWWSRRRYATDLVFYSEKGDGRRLLQAFRRWAWSVPGVVEITMGQSSGIDIERTRKLYERAGMKLIGHMYTEVANPANTQEQVA